MPLFILSVFIFGNICELSSSARIKFYQHMQSNQNTESLVKELVWALSASELAEVKAIRLICVHVSTA